MIALYFLDLCTVGDATITIAIDENDDCDDNDSYNNDNRRESKSKWL